MTAHVTDARTAALIAYLGEHVMLLAQTDSSAVHVMGEQMALTTRFGGDAGVRFTCPSRQYLDIASHLDPKKHDLQAIAAAADEILRGGDLAKIYHPHVLQRVTPMLLQVRDLAMASLLVEPAAPVRLRMSA